MTIRQLFDRLRIRHLDASIVAITLVLYSIAWPTLHLTHVVSGPFQPVVSGFAVAPLLLVRSNPVAGWGLSAVLAVVVGAVIDRMPGWNYPWQVVHLIVLLVLFVAVCVQARPSVVAAVWASTMLLFLGQMPGRDGTGWAVGLSATLALIVLVRWLMGSRRELAEQEQISDLERARRTVLEEKARIARDLHDVVAHHMSMVVVAAQTAPYRLSNVSPEAAAEFEEIGDSARAALNEIRGLLGVLRSDGVDSLLAPAPSAMDVTELLESSTRSGLSITWEITGDATRMSATGGLVIFRVAQESIANAARHAVGSPIDVRIEYGDVWATLSIVNQSAVNQSAAPRSTGHGIAGMRDRTAAVGGSFSAGSKVAGGFAVTVRVPIRPAADVAIALQ